MNTAFIWLNILWQPEVGDPNRFNGFLILGYALLWIIGLAYVISLAARRRNLHQDIRLMRQILQEDEKGIDK